MTWWLFWLGAALAWGPGSYATVVKIQTDKADCWGGVVAAGYVVMAAHCLDTLDDEGVWMLHNKFIRSTKLYLSSLGRSRFPFPKLPKEAELEDIAVVEIDTESTQPRGLFFVTDHQANLPAGSQVTYYKDGKVMTERVISFESRPGNSGGRANVLHMTNKNASLPGDSGLPVFAANGLLLGVIIGAMELDGKAASIRVSLLSGLAGKEILDAALLPYRVNQLFQPSPLAPAPNPVVDRPAVPREGDDLEFEMKVVPRPAEPARPPEIARAPASAPVVEKPIPPVAAKPVVPETMPAPTPETSSVAERENPISLASEKVPFSVPTLYSARLFRSGTKTGTLLFISPTVAVTSAHTLADLQAPEIQMFEGSAVATSFHHALTEGELEELRLKPTQQLPMGKDFVFIRFDQKQKGHTVVAWDHSPKAKRDGWRAISLDTFNKRVQHPVEPTPSLSYIGHEKQIVLVQINNPGGIRASSHVVDSQGRVLGTLTGCDDKRCQYTSLFSKYARKAFEAANQ